MLIQSWRLPVHHVNNFALLVKSMLLTGELFSETISYVLSRFSYLPFLLGWEFDVVMQLLTQRRAVRDLSFAAANMQVVFWAWFLYGFV